MTLGQRQFLNSRTTVNYYKVQNLQRAVVLGIVLGTFVVVLAMIWGMK